MRPSLGSDLDSAQARRMLSRLVPARRLVPSSIVMGRSVLSRRVRQGTPRAVVLFLDSAGIGQDHGTSRGHAEEVEVAERLYEVDVRREWQGFQQGAGCGGGRGSKEEFRSIWRRGRTGFP